MSISPEFKKMAKAIIENLRKTSNQHKQLYERSLATFEKDPLASIRIIRENPSAKKILELNFLEYRCWVDSFKKVVNDLNKHEQLKSKGFDIEDRLISLQHRIANVNSPHTSYMVLTMNITKTELQFDDTFVKKWRDQKKSIYIEKQKHMESTQMKNEQEVKAPQVKKIQEHKQEGVHSNLQIQRPATQKNEGKGKEYLAKEVSVWQIQQKRQKENERIARQNQQLEKQRRQKEERQRLQKQKQKAQNLIRKIEEEKRKKIQEFQRQIQKKKQHYSGKYQKVRESRNNAMMRYLQSRKQFNCGTNKQAVCREILSNLQRFMKDKIAKMVRVSKMKNPAYNSEQVGDQFRLYSQKSNSIDLRSPAMFPQTNLKIIKVQYPSKFENYLRIRIDQERQQQKAKNQLKQKYQNDRKLQKLVQGYLAVDVKQSLIHQFKRDEPPPRKDRLFVVKQAIQYVIQSDPWFGEKFVMEKTFFPMMA